MLNLMKFPFFATLTTNAPNTVRHSNLLVFFLNSQRLIVPVVLFILTESEIGSTLPIEFGLRFFFVNGFVYCIIWNQRKEKKNI